ncbi:MAG: RNA methyltransferase [Bacteroidetes bacterium]|nr:RNA methyltransferase [Bacteroidota bacterium]
MLSQNQIKHISALKIKKFRGEYQQFIAEGSKLVMDMINSEFIIAGLYASAEWIVENLALIHSKKIPAFETMPGEMGRISALATPSPVLAVVNMPFTTPGHSSFWEELGKGCLTIALDDIRDPGNLGTIIRIADWFGIYTVLCSESCVEIYNPKVVQATMGSIARVNVITCNLAEVFLNLSGRCKVFGTFLDGDPVFTQNLGYEGIILIGNESRGISQELIPFVTQKLFIPSFGAPSSGKAESLNASIATAIICAEFRRSMKS